MLFQLVKVVYYALVTARVNDNLMDVAVTYLLTLQSLSGPILLFLIR